MRYTIIHIHALYICTRYPNTYLYTLCTQHTDNPDTYTDIHVYLMLTRTYILPASIMITHTYKCTSIVLVNIAGAGIIFVVAQMSGHTGVCVCGSGA
jgi:hypothetical protein